MRFAFYCAVLIVALAGVVLGLDFMPAPMPPMPDVKNVVFVPPPAPPPRIETPASPPSANVPAAPPPATVAPSGAPVASAPAALPPAATEAKPVATTIAAPPRVKCDIDACDAAYKSFRESDCTYNPSFGPRRLCTKGNPEKYAAEHPAATATPPGEMPAPAAEPGAIMGEEPGAAAAGPATTAPPRCNVSACRAAYPRSFHEADCTFNPASGPRKLCEK